MKAYQKWLLLGSSILTGMTGLIYWWMKHMMEPVSEWAVINHPLQPWILKGHILVSPVLVFAVGLIASDHILRRPRELWRSGYGSGLLTLFLLAPMGFSGYLIQTVTHLGWLSALIWTHVGTGCLYLIAFGVHRRVFRSVTGQPSGRWPAKGDGGRGGAEEGRPEAEKA